MSGGAARRSRSSSPTPTTAATATRTEISATTIAVRLRLGSGSVAGIASGPWYGAATVGGDSCPQPGGGGYADGAGPLTGGGA
ncbi:hypothetical protein GCM10011608_48680 [Micromonospora sonchi]|uniref:Uncharacterized protein n=1 Tax=Micromonospora sonchi TaxID=1763543 RepID=A0A917U698_9ACTN|nr:hypothetical protein GCM10011608_48680 [Micromonospora sonchi]